MRHELCLLTVTHKADLSAFQILRRSVTEFAPNIKHFLLVDDEEIDFYRHKFNNELNLEIISSREILPHQWEKHRKMARWTRGGLLQRISNRLGFDRNPLSGWCLQQLLKIHFLAAEFADVVVFLDSDLILTSRFTPESIFEDGLLLLPEAPATSIEDFGFEISSRVMLGVNRSAPLKGAYSYIHQPPRFYSRTGRALINSLTQANQPTPWEYRFIRQQWPSEYHLLGYVARFMEHGLGYKFINFNTEKDTYEVRFAHDVKALESVLSLCLDEAGKRGFLLVQSNLGIHSSSLCRRLEQLLDDLITLTPTDAAGGSIRSESAL